MTESKIKKSYSVDDYHKWLSETDGSSIWVEKARKILGDGPQINYVTGTIIGMIFGFGIGYSSVGGPSLIFAILVLVFSAIGYFTGKSFDDQHDVKRKKLAMDLWRDAQDQLD